MTEQTKPDRSLIRDADLKQELVRHQRRNLAPRMGSEQEQAEIVR